MFGVCVTCGLLCLYVDGTTPVFDEIFGEYKVENGLATARALSSNYVSAIGELCE